MNAETTTREVVMKLSAKADPSMTQPMKEAARSSKEASKGEEEYQKILKQRIESYKLALRLKDDLAKAGIGAELSEEEKYQRMLKQRIKDYETAKRLKNDLAKSGVGERGIQNHEEGAEKFGRSMVGALGLGGLFNPATAAATLALTTFSAAVNTSESQLKKFYSSLEYDPKKKRAESNPVTYIRNREREQRDAGWFMRWLGSLGGERMGEEGYRTTLPHSRADYERYLTGRREVRNRNWLFRPSREQLDRNPPMSFEQWRLRQLSGRERDRLMLAAQQEGHYGPERFALQSRQLSQERTLDLEKLQIQSQRKAALHLRTSQVQFTGQGHAWRVAAINAVTAKPEYNREQQIEDVHRQLAVRQSLAEVSILGQTRHQTIKAQFGASLKQEGDLRQRYQTAAKEEQAAKAKAEAVRNENLGREENDRHNELVKSAVAKRKQAEDDLMQAQRRSLDFRKQGEESIAQTLMQQHNILRSNLETVQHQVEAEKRRVRGLQEDLSFANPMELRTAVGISRKIKAKQQLTQREAQYVRGHGEWFGKQVQEVAVQRMGNPKKLNMMNELMQNAGQFERGKALQKQMVEIKHALQVNIQADKAIFKQMGDIMARAFHDFQLQMKTQLDNAIRSSQYQQQAERRRMFPESN